MKDRFGEYYLLTGFEAKGHCFWCGTEISGRRRYCCQEHHELYLENFHWPEASNACLKRQGGACGDCGEVARWADELRIHHIIPLNGTPRLWNILNRPGNLIALCPSCHGKRHAALNKYNKAKNKYDKAKANGQLIMDFTGGKELVA